MTKRGATKTDTKVASDTRATAHCVYSPAASEINTNPAEDLFPRLLSLTTSRLSFSKKIER